MSSVHDVTDPNTWGPAIDEAVNTVSRGGLVVLPTDTVYGIGADAFDAEAVAALLAAKGRGRQMPPPVLVPDVRTLDGLATEVPDDARKLVEAFWPGGFTIILRAQPSLQWDLGETHGTVALRMPDHPAALALLRRTGPLAVSSANASGSPAALDVADARAQLGEPVSTYLDGGDAPGGVASTIVDATGPRLRVVRQGAITLEALNEVAPVRGVDEPDEDVADDATDGSTDDATDGSTDDATDENTEGVTDDAAPEAADASAPDASDEAAAPTTEEPAASPAEEPAG